MLIQMVVRHLQQADVTVRSCSRAKTDGRQGPPGCPVRDSRSVRVQQEAVSVRAFTGYLGRTPASAELTAALRAADRMAVSGR